MTSCDSKDIALKSLFLGPQAENATWFEQRWLEVLQHWVTWRRSLFSGDGPGISENDQLSELFLRRQAEVETRLRELLGELDGESPKFTPRFLGHMTSELALPALLGHAAVLLHNPNLTSREVSAVTSRLEREAIADLISMVDMPAEGLGHFTSGGTLANIEALWRALHRFDRTQAIGLRMVEEKLLGLDEFLSVGSRSWEWFDAQEKLPSPNCLEQYSMLHLGPHEFGELYRRITGRSFRSPIVLAPASRHFSWPKAVTLLGLGRDSLRDIALDGHGRSSASDVAEALRVAGVEGRPVLLMVSVTGGTSSGSVDPVHRIQDLLDEHRVKTGEEIWHHVDAAYGGYFCSLLKAEDSVGLSEEVKASLGGIGRVCSVTLDPHKLGFVPYSCGAFLARSALHYRSPAFDAPYLIKGNEGAWQHTIEGSRAATGAVATWMTCKTIGLGADGYGRILRRDLVATQNLTTELLRARDSVSILGPADLNVICFFLARQKESLRACNERTLRCFQEFLKSPNFSVSKTEFSLQSYARHACLSLVEKGIEVDDGKITCIRLVLMNPFFSSRETAVRYECLFVDELLAIISRL